VTKEYQTKTTGARDALELAVPERVSVVMADVADDMREGLLACEEVLMDPNPIGTVEGYGAEGHGAIALPDDDDLPCGCFLDGRSCLCQDEPVSRVDRHEVVTRDVGKSSQDLEVEGVVHRRQPAIASIER